MDVKVLMASGEEDTWNDAADTVVDHGAMVVVGELDEDDTDAKTLTVKEKDNETVFQVHAVYAPGMWIKVEYS
jgi:hypothetical protein